MRELRLCLIVHLQLSLIHIYKNIDVLDALSEFNGYITYLDKKSKAGYADETDDFSENGKASRKILRKDIEDTASALIKFLMTMTNATSASIRTGQRCV